MRKLFMAALIVAATAPFTFAQTDYNKVDVGVLFSHNRVDTGIDDPNQNFVEQREGFNGVEGFVKGNVSRYVGVKGAYSYYRKSFDIIGGTPATNFEVDANLHQFLGGVEIKDNAKETKVKPFAHVMAGVGHARFELEGLTNTVESETGFAMAFGGGVDFKLSDRVDLRAVQIDYNPTRADGQTGHNFRVGIGLIFR